MLKALELIGFKSFADRTRFDFPDGITVVVGPNGSGKSNIVDAMKWVLGTQSPKSLRGKEMSDVIFKGSSDRKAAGAAEATIIFDNAEGALPVDAPEVHLTRRVYRSGESEYLINGAPCRLKDVRDLIRGTGVGVDAYSLIEQGKVDRMLQASARDRRAIFEEAAGISRFKAKKVEAQRRLGRVDQNLLRLGDIVDEVAGRLQNLKGQATKAERYRQQAQRLQELRTRLAWTDWLALSGELERLEQEQREALQQAEEAERQRAEAIESRQRIDLELQEVGGRAQEIENARTEALRRIAVLAGSREADLRSLAEQDAAFAKLRRRLLALQSQAGSTSGQLRELTARLHSARGELDAAQREADRVSAERDAANRSAEAARERLRAAQQQATDAHRAVSELASAIQHREARRESVEQTLQGLRGRAASAREATAAAEQQCRSDEQAIETLDEQIAALATEIGTLETELNDRRRLLARRREESSALQGRLQGVTERLGVLEELERRQEGVATGVRQLVEQARREPAGPLADVVGMVAELLDVDVHLAPLIDVALGPTSQFVAVRSAALPNAVAAGQMTLGGRIGLVRLDAIPPRRPGDRIRLDGLKGVLGRADKLVQAEGEAEPLARHLLGTTWLVDTLATALRLSRLSGAGLRFVTSRCELLDRDGTLVVGPAHAAAGLVSRRSELAAARQEQKHYRYQISELEEESSRLVDLVDQREAELAELQQQHRGAVTERAAAGARAAAAADRLGTCRSELAELDQQRAVTDEELAELRTEIAEGEAAILQRRAAADERDRQLQGRREAVAEAEAALAEAGEAMMRRSVALARAEQRLEAVSATVDQLRRDHSERRQAVDEVRGQIDSEHQRRDAVEGRLLRAGSELATLHLDVQHAASRLQATARQLADVRRRQRQAQKQLDDATRTAAGAGAAVQEAAGKLENSALRRRTLAERLKEDYEIDLHAEQPPEDFAPPEDRQAAEQEVRELREALQRSGSVNMEALAELDELQSRYDTLHAQYQDLTAAKQSLERIIQRINTDSRRLFLDTLEAIRLNFQQLYRKSFGGGTADLVLDAADDPLEAGVEIVATPPGKPSFSNSLLSGGEKALTAVALLMAIFQYRPSPFCVLDEVDAPFDEANIGRFVSVLREFLSQTKFVVVTHSKKTMTAATTLYGVTMQESGVSTRVAVRFEDVEEDGTIVPSAEDRDGPHRAAA